MTAESSLSVVITSVQLLFLVALDLAVAVVEVGRLILAVPHQDFSIIANLKSVLY